MSRKLHADEVGRIRVREAVSRTEAQMNPGTRHAFPTIAQEVCVDQTVPWDVRITCPSCAAKLEVRKLAKPYRCPSCRHTYAPCHVCSKRGKPSCPIQKGKPCPFKDEARYEAVQVIYEKEANR